MVQNKNNMKKLFPVAAVAVLALTFTSCKKDYKCTCTWDISGTPGTYSWDLGKQKKKDAEAACKYAAALPGVTYNCKLD